MSNSTNNSNNPNFNISKSSNVTISVESLAKFLSIIFTIAISATTIYNKFQTMEQDIDNNKKQVSLCNENYNKLNNELNTLKIKFEMTYPNQNK